MKKLRSVLRLYQEQYSKQSISKSLRLSRNTVRRYLLTYEQLGLSFEQTELMNDAELFRLFNDDPLELKESDRLVHLKAFFPYMSKELKRTGVTRQLLWEEYRTLHNDGYGLTQFKEYYNRWCKRVNPVMHIDHKAGEKLFVDFAGKKLELVDKDSGEVREVEMLVAILPSSQYTYAQAVMSQQKEDFIMALENALHYFGGVPRLIIPDNLKSAVTKVSWYEPQLNETFEDFLHHYDTASVPARPKKPRDKASVEGVVRIIYSSIYAPLRKQTFFTLEELNLQISILLEEHNNTKLTGRPYSRRELFEETEKDVLAPLAAHRFELREYAWATVLQNGHVCLREDRHYYSVPYHFIKRKVKLSYSSKVVEIYCNHQCIATHPRLKSPHNYTTTENHLASTHQFMGRWNPQFFIEWGGRIGEDVRRFIEQMLEKKKHPEQAYRSCMGVLSMEKKVGAQRLENACSRALDYGLYNYNIIRSILEKGLDKIQEEEQKEVMLPAHQNIRGKDYYQ